MEADMTSQNFQLVMQKGPNPGKVFELTQDEITIGRDISNRFVINDPEVSRRHARLTAQASGYVIEDLGSTNGTFVDGQRLMGPHLLRPGQTVMFGEKITLAYQALGFDPNATLASPASVSPVSQDTYRVPPSDIYAATPPEPTVHEELPPAYVVPPAQAAPVYPPAYSSQVPAGPVEVYEEVEQGYEEEAAPRQPWKLALVGCGVLVVILCCLVVAVVAFDYMNMYCQPPFSALSGVLWNCP
jgi:pSer/pThr/pTyr-binding forkhead associated (FHA) protein